MTSSDCWALRLPTLYRASIPMSRYFVTTPRQVHRILRKTHPNAARQKSEAGPCRDQAGGSWQCDPSACQDGLQRLAVLLDLDGRKRAIIDQLVGDLAPRVAA